MNVTLKLYDGRIRVRVGDQQHWLTEPRVGKGSPAGGEWTSGGGGGTTSPIKGAGITSEWTGSSTKKKGALPKGRHSAAETTTVHIPATSKYGEKGGAYDILVNPTKADVEGLMRKDQYGHARAMHLQDGTIIAWKASEDLHDFALEKLIELGEIDEANAEIERADFGHHDGQHINEWDGLFRKGGGEGEEFVSPNVTTHMDFAQAVDALGSKRHQDMRAAAEDVDKALGITGREEDVVGAWADGAEDSVMATVARPDWESLRAAAAMKGYLGNQKSVLAFKSEHNGPALMLSFVTRDDIARVHADLLQAGVAFHTLVQVDRDHVRAMAVDTDGSMIDPMEKAARRHETSVRYVEGKAEFIGTTKDTGSDAEQRADARTEYERVIASSQPAKLPAGQAATVWGGLRAKWGRVLEATELGPQVAKKRNLGPLGHGYSSQAKLIDGVVHTTNVHDAARALYENRRVELAQPDEVATLIKFLGKVSARMIAMGEKAPIFNLCKVAVVHTNLFCAESKGIPRVKMPQLDREQTKAFIEYLGKQGYKTEKTKLRSDHLRATQDELDGAKVAKVAAKIKADPDKAKRLIVSRDNYILDGHHHWAAEIGLDAKDNKFDRETKITRVDISITKLLALAETFTGGKGHQALGDEAWTNEPRVPAGQAGGGEWTKGAGGAESQEWQEQFEATGHVQQQQLQKAGEQWVSAGEKIMAGKASYLPQAEAAGGLSTWKPDAMKDYQEQLKAWQGEADKLAEALKGAMAEWSTAGKQTTVALTELNGVQRVLADAQYKSVHPDELTPLEAAVNKAGAAYADAVDVQAKAKAKADAATAEVRAHEAKKPPDPRPYAQQFAEWQAQITRQQNIVEFTGEAMKDAVDHYQAVKLKTANIFAGDPHWAAYEREFQEAGKQASDARQKYEQAKDKLAQLQAGPPARPLGEPDPRVLDVGGDAWNRETALRLEKEYEQALPEIERLVTAPEQEVAAGEDFDAQKAQQAYVEMLHPDDNEHGMAAWEQLKHWQKLDWVKNNAPELLQAPAPEKGPEEETEPDYAAAWEQLPGNVQALATSNYAKQFPTSASFNSLSDWGKYHWVKTHQPDLLKGTAPPPPMAKAPEEEEAEEPEPFPEPEEWDQIGGDMQEAAEEQWKQANHDDMVNSEIENWQQDAAFEQGREQLVDDFNNGNNVDWLENALHDNFVFAGEAEEGDKPDIPFTKEQIVNALSLEGKNYYESGFKPDITIADDRLGLPVGWTGQEEALPGIEAEKPSDRLTEKMRQEITEAITGAFPKAVDKWIDDYNYQPDEDYIQEQLGESWDAMDDSDKFSYLQKNTSLIEDAKTEWEDAHGTPDQPEAPPSSTTPRRVIPKHFDPVESYEAHVADRTEADYRDTQKLARWLSVNRAAQVLKKRGIKFDKSQLARIDKELWEGWKESSHGDAGLLLQQAVADELGGRMRYEGQDAESIKAASSYRVKPLGGYEGMKAYIRAKWETTQYLLDKANMPVVNLYRGISLDPNELDKQAVVIPGEKPEETRARTARLKELTTTLEQRSAERQGAMIKLGEAHRRLAQGTLPTSWGGIPLDNRKRARKLYAEDFIKAHPDLDPILAEARAHDNWADNLSPQDRFDYAQQHDLVTTPKPQLWNEVPEADQAAIKAHYVAEHSGPYSTFPDAPDKAAEFWDAGYDRASRLAYAQSNDLLKPGPLLSAQQQQDLQAQVEKLVEQQTLAQVAINEASKERDKLERGLTGAKLMPDLHVARNGALSTTLDRSVANGWGAGGGGHVVLRVQAPRTAVISVPAYGINVHSEKEVVLGGLAYHGWEAFRGPAPSFEDVAMQKEPPAKTGDSLLPKWLRRKGRELTVDILSMEIASKLPHWLHGTKFDKPKKPDGEV